MSLLIAQTERKMASDCSVFHVTKHDLHCGLQKLNVASGSRLNRRICVRYVRSTCDYFSVLYISGWFPCIVPVVKKNVNQAVTRKYTLGVYVNVYEFLPRSVGLPQSRIYGSGLPAVTYLLLIYLPSYESGSEQSWLSYRTFCVD